MKHKKRNDNILILEEFDQVFIEEELTSRINYYLIVGVLCCSFFIGFFVVEVMKGVEEASMEEKKEE